MSNLLVPFLYELRNRHLKVGTVELVSLAKAVTLGLHGNTLEGFYYLARSVMVHRESDLDDFDRAFSAHFRGQETIAQDLLAELSRALEDLTSETPRASHEGEGEAPNAVTPDMEAALDGQRRAPAPPRDEGLEGERSEQPENRRRAKGPRGNSALPGPVGKRSVAADLADARRYKGYRSDRVLDIRQVEVALRRLRTFARNGRQTELDIDGTVDATARAFGELEVVLRAPKRSETRVLLLMDIGGSMEPFAQACSRLFSAAKRASNLRELQTYYFHNIVYGRVFSTDKLAEPVEVPDLVERINQRWKLVMVGDASMAPGEMLSVGPFGSALRRPDGGPMTGLDWLLYLGERFDRSVWLNPDPPSYWPGGTSEVIGQVFPMYTMTLDGLAAAVAYLAQDSPGKKPKIIGNPRNAL